MYVSWMVVRPLILSGKLLPETNIDATTFLAFKPLYTNMTSCVRYQGKHSEWFRILEGVRQDGKSSPILYLLYINGLIHELEQSGFGICV